MVLAAGCRVSGGQLTHAEGAAADGEEADYHAIDDGHGAASEETEEHSGGNAAPAVADIEAGREDVEGFEGTGRSVASENGCVCQLVVQWYQTRVEGRVSGNDGTYCCHGSLILPRRSHGRCR